MTQDGWPFSIVQRVRFGDLDAMQHLNNVEFLRYFETARIAFFMEHWPEHSPGDPGAFGFIFGECKINYRSPVSFDEEVRTYIRPGRLGTKSLTLDFEMRVEGDGRLAAEGHGVLVGYDYGSGSSRKIPDDLRERLTAIG